MIKKISISSVIWRLIHPKNIVDAANSSKEYSTMGALNKQGSAYYAIYEAL